MAFLGYALPVSVSTEDIDLLHPQSSRTVPVRRYNAVGSPKAWLLFSVGYGGDRSGYAFLARCWAHLGVTTFVVEHPGSNLEVLKSFSQKTRLEINREIVKRVQDPVELQARPRDLSLVWETQRHDFGELPLGLGGHSYGTYTVLACAGLEPRATHHHVEPLPAHSLLIISPQPPGMMFAPTEYQKVSLPCLLLTGTEDHLLAGQSDYLERLKVYECLPPQNRHLAVLEKVAHMTFAGIGLGIGSQLESIKKLTSLWWHESLCQESPTGHWKDLLYSTLSPSEITECR